MKVWFPDLPRTAYASVKTGFVCFHKFTSRFALAFTLLYFHSFIAASYSRLAGRRLLTPHCDLLTVTFRNLQKVRKPVRLASHLTMGLAIFILRKWKKKTLLCGNDYLSEPCPTVAADWWHLNTWVLKGCQPGVIRGDIFCFAINTTTFNIPTS